MYQTAALQGIKECWFYNNLEKFFMVCLLYNKIDITVFSYIYFIILFQINFNWNKYPNSCCFSEGIKSEHNICSSGIKLSLFWAISKPTFLGAEVNYSGSSRFNIGCCVIEVIAYGVVNVPYVLCAEFIN